MNNDIVFLVEAVLVFGLVIGWGVWELVKLNREKAKDAEKARKSETEQDSE